ncbi:LysR family transcriptional regulator [Nocardia jinanensis]|uniref:LysR family transcriptional regulator n=1 Tax=Nocardia jinanensis TaxID=382504 RepID=A0A917RI95_9NOCA|nr:LysR family transcriptional regulator [Nocardia jinanensis]GGL07228.1 LysR family transcriptional regulator [Nocardia jinanensis]
MDVDTRLLRYFAAVAAEGNLTRAAERLYVSQPALTKQIKQLENLLGVRLFVRSRAGMALTAAGEALAGRTASLLTGWDRALQETRRAAAQADRLLRVGFLASAANEATPRIIAEFSRRLPGWRVDMRQASWADPTGGLADAEVDVALLRLPFPAQDRFRVRELFGEPRWVAVASAHPLAAREAIAFEDLLDEPFVAAPAETGAWRDYWLSADEHTGWTPRIGAVTDQPDEWLSAIANGYGVALAPESSARFYARPGITYRPVTGVAPSRVGVVWHAESDTDSAVQAFVDCCTESSAGTT